MTTIDFKTLLKTTKEQKRLVSEKGGVDIKPITVSHLFCFIQTHIDTPPLLSLYLIDLRQRTSFESKHIRGAILIEDSADACDRFPCESDWMSLPGAPTAPPATVVIYTDSTFDINSLSEEGKLAVSHIRKSVHIVKEIFSLRGGLSDFSDRFPFLCLSFHSEGDATYSGPAYMNYPIEVIPEKLYMGNVFHGSNSRIIQRLGIKSILDLTPNGVPLECNTASVEPKEAHSSGGWEHVVEDTHTHTDTHIEEYAHTQPLHTENIVERLHLGVHTPSTPIQIERAVQFLSDCDTHTHTHTHTYTCVRCNRGRLICCSCRCVPSVSTHTHTHTRQRLCSFGPCNEKKRNSKAKHNTHAATTCIFC
eukprot:GHVR01121462.1.p1 GENE.GHVR01121462.1~~GHVR01121462.1.p1  ORF type:complete len:363 (+),score=101.12 GHVR01121462.1:414-1502(+)